MFDAATPRPAPAWRAPVGLVLVLPAFALLLWAYAWPAVWTVWTSFHRVNLIRGGSGGYTTRNYSSVFHNGLAGQFGFALTLAVVPIVIVLVAAPLLAWAAARGGLVARWVTRGVLALPLAMYAPVAIAAARMFSLAESRRLPSPATMVRSAYWWGTFGLVAALATTVYLAALRRRDPQRRPWPAFAVAGGIALAATVAAALQDFTYGYLTTRGSRGSATPVVQLYTDAFMRADLGRAAATSTVLLAVLGLLGLVVTLAIVLSGLRLEFDEERTPAGGDRTLGLAIAAVVLVALAAGAIYGLSPLLGKVFGHSAPAPLPASTATIEANTWVPTLLTAVVSVAVAVLAAFGIGWLRPVGRYSEWLLLPFGLFLFVGTGPLVLHGYDSARAADRLNTSLSLVPPVWVAVPALFVLVLLFRGQAERAEAQRRAGQPAAVARHLVLALPMVVLAFLVTWVVRAQDLTWQLFASVDPKQMTAPVALVEMQQAFGITRDAAPYGLVLPVVLLVLFFLLAVAAQLFYLDRLALRTD